jgi:hypothetical protein
MRPFEEDGSWGAKSHSVNGRKIPTVDWNERKKAEYWRKSWARYQNAALKEHSYEVSVDHRSFQRQGKEQIPTVHLGSSAWMESRGTTTELGDKNREIIAWNKELRQIRARLKKLKTWLYAQPLENTPSMGDVLRNINNSQQLKSKAQKIKDLQTYISVTEFLRENNLNSIESLADKVTDMHQEQYDIAGVIKKHDRRLKTIDTHLANVALFNAVKPVYKRYVALDPKKRDLYKNQNAAAIAQYEAAHKYLTEHLNGRSKIPEGAWKAEHEKLLQERYSLTEQYYDLKADVKSVEKLQRGAENIIGEVKPERKKVISRKIDL